MNSKKIYAYFRLAILFFIHIIKMPFKSGENQVKQFHKNYHSDDLIELSDCEYEKISMFEECIHCSLCDVYCPVLSDFHRDGVPRLSSFFLANSRSMPLFRYSYEELKLFAECKDCKAPCTNICPNEYPIFELISFMNGQNQRYIDEIIDKKGFDPYE
ncbi:hypothetical protein JXR93_09760 [bacterium]|nr:hypothetical protein [bacterium]